MYKTSIPFKSETGITLNIPYDQLVALLEEYHTCKLNKKKPVKFPSYLHEWVDEPGYDPMILDNWMSGLKDNKDLSHLAKDLRNHLSGYYTKKNLKNTILKADWKAFMKSEWVKFALKKYQVLQAGKDIRMRAGGVAAALFTARFNQLFHQPVSTASVKSIVPVTQSLMKRYGPASQKAKEVRFSDYYKNADLEYFIKRAASPADKNKKNQLLRDQVIVELLVIIESCEKQLSERSATLLSGLIGVWLGYLPEEKSAEVESTYKEKITNMVRAVKQRTINKLRKA